ncbi:MAG: ATP-binding protein [Gammaproteobacteria bacterium]
MSLRIQLLGVGLLTLALPWAGYRYVQELEGALRDGLEQSLLASAITMAAAMELQPLTGPAQTGEMAIESTIYAHPLDTPPSIDGYRDDWSSAADTVRPLGSAAEYWAGLHERTVYVFLNVTDDDLIYQSAPTQTPYGDRVLLLPGRESDGWLLLHGSGPGSVRSQQTQAPLFAPTAQYEDRVTAYWRETAGGYSVEARLPLDLVRGRLGLAVIDVDHAAVRQTPEAAFDVSLQRSWQAEPELGPGAFVYRPQHLDAIGGQFVQPGRRLRVVDPLGWVLFDGGAIDPLSNEFAPSSLGLAERFYRFILARGDAPYQGLEDPPGRMADATSSAALQGESVAAWYARGPDASAVVAAAAPIRAGDEIRGGVVLEQSSDSILTLTNEALVRLMSFTLLASLSVALGLLSYATLLSFRIRRLALAAETALSPEGEIRPALPGRRAGDEIGDLARSFTALLQRLREYTEYLTTLKAKLAHELRTPLAIVTTSLDNLEREPQDHVSPYVARLREGTDRLDAILGAMSEATLIEQAVADTDPELFSVGEVIASCVEAYRDVYQDRRFELRDRAVDARVLGSADLIAQMLDKLVDNAVSFSPSESTITLTLNSSERHVGLRVTNVGPLLPDAMRNQLFDSLVSMREERGQGRHLGLGLYIVALIVDFHRGTVRAEDLPDGSGVSFDIELPRVR